eukprot:CAMPEP_0204000164 /NCGR_PEP_ID=MMETSP0360-20130528/15131_1 /ASSEMBLY_ACC=CAM_ASM_000342 /TAXON_ID=268821 /ORGANISM="Scrippsiella Hangoei, Strain SHTV-5" /LENGTH=213 /DNA_ID=CAMNT_0050941407 /DNA_START=676 /DNA_END=1319 /DNA_ORIENTATION=+
MCVHETIHPFQFGRNLPSVDRRSPNDGGAGAEAFEQAGEALATNLPLGHGQHEDLWCLEPEGPAPLLPLTTGHAETSDKLTPGLCAADHPSERSQADHLSFAAGSPDVKAQSSGVSGLTSRCPNCSIAVQSLLTVLFGALGDIPKHSGEAMSNAKTAPENMKSDAVEASDSPACRGISSNRLDNEATAKPKLGSTIVAETVVLDIGSQGVQTA